MAAALPLEELFGFTAGEMLAFKRRGLLPSVAELIGRGAYGGPTGTAVQRRAPAHKELLDRSRLLRVKAALNPIWVHVPHRT
jgi:hypothetical protein